MAHRLTTCTFCGVGCGIYLETAGDRVLGAYPSLSHPANQGHLCVRGWNVHEVASSPDRLKTPLLRRGNGLEAVSWDTALAFLVERMQRIRADRGPDAFAFFNSPRCSNEETYLLQKLARAVIGTNNVDHGTGVYCHNSIDVLLEMLGVPATTNSIGELDRSEVIVVDSVDLGSQLPTIGGRVMRAKLRGARLVVIDPRRHRIAEHADWFLQLRPGTEVCLFGAMAKVIVDRGLANLPFIKARCRNHEAFLESVASFDLLGAASHCGVDASLIEAAALAYARAGAAAWLYSTGVETRGRETIQAMVNLAMLTGQLGKAGAGLYALTEHNNLQGVCDMGMLPNRLPGYRPVDDTLRRLELGARWRAELPTTPGLGTRQVFDNGGGDQVRAVWLCRYDPVTTATFCDAAATLAQMELVVVQHLFKTTTAEYAHCVLPVTAFGEEQVTYTSTDRRIQLAEKVVEPAAGLMPAWRQLMFTARALGADWRYLTASEVMDEIGDVIPAYSGASYQNLARDYGRQWPCTQDRPLGTPFLFQDPAPGHPFSFAPVPRPEAPAAVEPEYPMALVFGHSHYYWHHNVLVKHSETLRRELRVLLLDYPRGFVEINHEDAQRLGVRDGASIRLTSARGKVETAARVTSEVRSGTIFVPFFVREVERRIWGHERLGVGDLNNPVYVRVETL